MTLPQAFRLSLRDDIKLVEEVDGGLTLQKADQPLAFKHLSQGWHALLKQLATSGATEHELGRIVLDIDGEASLLHFYPKMQQLLQKGIVCHTVMADNRPFATIIPIASAYRFQEALPDPQQPYILSRFAYCHSQHGQFTLDSPLAYAKIALHDARASALLAMLAQPQTVMELSKPELGLEANTVRMFLALLLNAQAIVAVDASGQNMEESSPTLAQWEFHDLLFHSRSRFGRHNNPYGGTFASKGKFAALPAIKEVRSDEIIPLDKPDLARLVETDPPLTAVIEQRRSIRTHGEKPISIQQLGEFLYRVARVKKLISIESDELGVSFRPYPAGGALYELEIYPVINRCAGLAAGLYYYHPLNHHLCKIAERNSQVDMLLDMAGSTALMQSQPQLYFAITSRFQRLQWKYQGVAYALMLKHVGVLYQTMYLAATAMGLAPCALGGGNADLFAAAAQLDYYAETTVGEFVLGTIGEARPQGEHKIPAAIHSGVQIH